MVVLFPNYGCYHGRVGLVKRYHNCIIAGEMQGVIQNTIQNRERVFESVKIISETNGDGGIVVVSNYAFIFFGKKIIKNIAV